MIALAVLYIMQQQGKPLTQTGEVEDGAMFQQVSVASVYDGDTFKINLNCSLAVYCEKVPVRVRGVDTPEQATLLRGQTVSIDRSGVCLPEGTVFIADLIGCRVVTEEGEEIGRIKDVLTMPSSDVYVIEGARSYMIPAVKEFVREIDTAAGVVRVHLIEGMATDEN